MSASTAKRLAIALAAALLMAAAVCWGPGSRTDPAPTATEVAVSAPLAASTPTASTPPVPPAPTPAASPTTKSAQAATPTPTIRSDRGGGAAATSTPFTLSDLAATSTPITALLPPALPTVTVPPTPTATPAPTAAPTVTVPPTPTATSAPIATPTATEAPSPTATPAATTELLPPALPTGPTVEVGNTVFSVDIASTPEEKRIGLSGREGLAPASGMLFLYASGRPYQFWMKDMLFAIDIVWIAPGCTVGDITYDLQPPRAGAPDSEVLRASPSIEAAHVLEIVGGASRELGLRIGDPVRFVGISEPAGDSC